MVLAVSIWPDGILAAGYLLLLWFSLCIHSTACLHRFLARTWLPCLTGDFGTKTFERALVALLRLRIKYISFILGFLPVFKIRGDAAKIFVGSNIFSVLFQQKRMLLLHHLLLMLLPLPRASSRLLRLREFWRLERRKLLLLLTA